MEQWPLGSRCSGQSTSRSLEGPLSDARGRCSQAAVENLPPAVTSRISKEVRALVKAPPEGSAPPRVCGRVCGRSPDMRACHRRRAECDSCPPATPWRRFTANLWVQVCRPVALPPRPSTLLSVLPRAEKTPYEGGVFRLKLVMGSDYPSAPPKGARSKHVPIVVAPAPVLTPPPM